MDSSTRASLSDPAAAGTSSKLPSQPHTPALTNARSLHFSFSHAQQTTRGAMGPPSNGPLVQRHQSLKRKIEDILPDTRHKGSDQSLSQQRTSISQLSRQLGLGLKALSQSHASSLNHKISQRQLSSQRITQSQQPSTLPVAADTVPYFQTPSEIARSLHIIPSQPSGQPVATNASSEHQTSSGIAKAPVHGQTRSRLAHATGPTYRRSSEAAISPCESSSQSPSRASTLSSGPRYQSLSEVATSSVHPKQTTTILSRSKKHPSTPPLVTGGYAERLFNLMTRQVSEFSAWANSTMCKEHFRIAKPLATVVVVHVSRSHGLQWCQCRVICSSNNQPPFNVDQTHSYPGSIAEVEHPPTYGYVGLLAPGVISTPGVRSDRTLPSKQTGVSVSGDTSMSQEDSICGLHKDIHGLHVISSQGSVFGHPVDSLLSQRQPHGQNLQQPDSRPESSVCYLKSSQGSEDEHEEIDGCSGREPTSLHADMLLSRTNKAKGMQIAIEEIEDGEKCAPESATNMSAAVSNVSTIDDSLSDRGMPTVPTPMEFARPAAEFELLSKKTFTIIFSNLFNWSTLKVSDRVEIHDPCRSLALPVNKDVTGSELIWIVERFKVV